VEVDCELFRKLSVRRCE